MKRRSDDPRFRWQDKAADTAAGRREAAAAGGAFIVNMASTGCGKTLANARVMYALAEPQHGMRCSFALGLSTLTLQTGRSCRDDMRMGDDDLAIRVGGAASRESFRYQEALAESSGSASVQPLLDEGDDGRARTSKATPRAIRCSARPCAIPPCASCWPRRCWCAPSTT